MAQWLEENVEVKQQQHTGDMTQFLQKLLAGWYWILVGSCTGLALAWVYLRYTTPEYKVRAKILVNDEKKGGNIIGQNSLIDLGSLLKTKNSVDNEAEILKTRYLMERTVRETDAYITYYKKGTVKDRELFQPPFRLMLLALNDTIRSTRFNVDFIGEDSVQISNETTSYKVPFDRPFRLNGIGLATIRRDSLQPVRFEGYAFRVSSIDDQVAQYMSRLSVQVSNKQVTTIDLAFNYPIPAKGEYILRSLLTEYANGSRDDRNTIADSTIAFIDNRLLLVSRELDNVEGNIQQFKQQNRLADLSEQSRILLDNASQYVKQLAEVETQINMVNSLSERLKTRKEERIAPSAILPQDMVFSALVDRYNGLLTMRDEKLMNATAKNPVVQNMNEQIGHLQEDMIANLSTTGDNLLIARNALQGKVGGMESEVRKVPATERIYLDLARQQQIKQELFVFLLQKREETAISKTSNIANAKVIDPPKSDNQPYSPRRFFILLVGLLAGVIGPVGIIYLRSYFNTRLMNRIDVTSRTQLPVIAEIGNSAKGELVVKDGVRTPIAEQLRTLRTNLSFFLKENERRILLTSSMSGEGKSFIALNLSAVLALSGTQKKVLLVELDLRKPKVTEKLGKENKLGVTNFIISPGMRPEDIVQPSGLRDNLFLMSSGPVPPNPAELILHERMDELMAWASDQFDYVIIDAPPIGLVTDAQLLGKYADLTLYIVRQGYTFKHQINIAEELYRSRKLKNMALLVNDIKQGYAYTGGGYYDGKYAYYSQDKPVHWFKKLLKRKQ